MFFLETSYDPFKVYSSYKPHPQRDFFAIKPRYNYNSSPERCTSKQDNEAGSSVFLCETRFASPEGNSKVLSKRSFQDLSVCKLNVALVRI